MDATPVTATGVGLQYPWFFGAGDCFDNRTASLGAVVPVTAGAHTVHVDAIEYGAGTYIYARDVSVIFFPQGSGVTIPVLPRADAARSQNKSA